MKQIIFLLLLMNAYFSYGQIKETVTNKSVIDLTKAGFDSSLIASKIETSDCKFDLSTTGLITLKKANVSPYVITVMMNKSMGSKTTPSSPLKAVSEGSVIPAKNSESKIENGSVPEPDIINLVHYYNKSKNQITPLERASANMRSRAKMLGYGGVNMTYEVHGEKSPVRIPKNDALSFVVNAGGGTGDGFILYKVEVKGSTRRAVAMAVSSIAGMKGSKGVIAINTKMLKQSIYELIPTSALEPGEYFFAKSANTATTSNADVYAFGVD